MIKRRGQVFPEAAGRAVQHTVRTHPPMFRALRQRVPLFSRPARARPVRRQDSGREAYSVHRKPVAQAKDKGRRAHSKFTLRTVVQMDADVAQTLVIGSMGVGRAMGRGWQEHRGACWVRVCNVNRVRVPSKAPLH